MGRFGKFDRLISIDIGIETFAGRPNSFLKSIAQIFDGSWSRSFGEGGKTLWL